MRTENFFYTENLETKGAVFIGEGNVFYLNLNVFLERDIEIKMGDKINYLNHGNGTISEIKINGKQVIDIIPFK